MACRYITEQGDFVLDAVVQRMFGTADENIRLNAHSLELFYTCLSRFGFHFLRSAKIRNQGYMDQDDIFMPHIMLELTKRFQERLTFDIAYGSAYFNDCNLCVGSGWVSVKTAFDFVCDMGNDLDGSSSEVSPAFLLQNRPVNFTGCNIGISGKTFINKTFIMSEIEIGFRTVIGYEYFSVLYRIHGSRVNVDIWIEFLHGDRVAACF